MTQFELTITFALSIITGRGSTGFIITVGIAERTSATAGRRKEHQMPKSDADYKLSPEERASAREFMKLYREQNREQYNAYHREYYRTHKRAAYEAAMRYRATHAEEYKAQRKEYYKKWKERKKANDNG